MTRVTAPGRLGTSCWSRRTRLRRRRGQTRAAPAHGAAAAATAPRRGAHALGERPSAARSADFAAHARPTAHMRAYDVHSRRTAGQLAADRPQRPLPRVGVPKSRGRAPLRAVGRTSRRRGRHDPPRRNISHLLGKPRLRRALGTTQGQQQRRQGTLSAWSRPGGATQADRAIVRLADRKKSHNCMHRAYNERSTQALRCCVQS